MDSTAWCGWPIRSCLPGVFPSLGERGTFRNIARFRIRSRREFVSFAGKNLGKNYLLEPISRIYFFTQSVIETRATRRNASMNMMPMMNAMMGGMGQPMMIIGKMTDAGMACEMKPMEGMAPSMFMECCKRMMVMMNGGMPMMRCCSIAA